MGLIIVLTAWLYYKARTKLMGEQNLCPKCDCAFVRHIYGCCPDDFAAQPSSKFSGI